MYNCCVETNRVYTDRNTIVCTICGLEKKVSFDLSKEPNDWTRTPVVTCYSRRKRFAKLFDNTLAPYAEKNDTSMLEYLGRIVKKEGKFETYAEMLNRIKHSPLRDKRYGSLHIFAKMFLITYKKPKYPQNILLIRKRILRRFEDFEFAHKRHRLDNYFNYRWLLAKLLIELNLTEYLQFVKRLKCPIRSQHYEDMFNDLQTKITHTSPRW